MADVEKLSILDPLVIFAAIAAFIGDISWLIAIFALAAPVIGLPLALYILVGRYVAATIVGFSLWAKAKGWLAKIVLILAVLIPLPLLVLGIILVVLLSNRFIRFLAEQAVIAVVGTATAGAGVVAGEAVAVGEVAAGAAEIAAAGGEITAGAEAAAEAGITAERAVTAEETATAEAGVRPPEAPEKEIAPEALGEEPTPFEKLRELTEKMPEAPEKKEKEEEVEIDDEANEVNLKET